MASMSSVDRPASEKFATPNVRRMRSDTASTGAVGPRTISMRPISGANGLHVEIGNGLPEMPDQAAQEPGPVLSLERELLIVDDD